MDELSKILKDPFYSKLYKKTSDLEVLRKAGWFNDNLDSIDYALWFRCTPTHKLIKPQKGETPIILLSTGSYDPLHEGHIHNMDIAKKELEKQGCFISGAYLSPSHDSYVLNKSTNQNPIEKRIHQMNLMLSENNFISICPFEAKFTPSAINFTDVIIRLELYLKKYFHPKSKVVYVFGSDNQEFSFAFEKSDLSICIQRDHHPKKKSFPKENIFIENNPFSHKKSSIIRGEK